MGRAWAILCACLVLGFEVGGLGLAVVELWEVLPHGVHG